MGSHPESSELSKHPDARGELEGLIAFIIVINECWWFSVSSG